MFKDPKIQLSIVLFLIFTIAWGILTLGLHIDDKVPFVGFISQIALATWGMVLLFIKPDGGIPKDDKGDDSPKA